MNSILGLMAFLPIFTLVKNEALNPDPSKLLKSCPTKMSASPAKSWKFVWRERMKNKFDQLSILSS